MNLSDYLIANEETLRLAFFGGIIAVMLLWELISPRRKLSQPRVVRWGSNIAIVVLNSAVIRWLFPFVAIGVAVFAAEHGWGLLHYTDWPLWLEVIIAVMFLDFMIYLQHVMVHAVPLLWRIHRVHHADLDYDFTTGSRFHPFEIMLSLVIKFAVILVLGPPVLAVVLFEIILNVSSMFNHGNVRIASGIDKYLRWLIVTPDMHRVHHSSEADETNTNFGFFLPWWDRLLGTYRDQPRKTHEAMQIGLRKHRDPKEVVWLHGMLLLPFKPNDSDYSIDKRAWSGASDAPDIDTATEDKTSE